MAQAQAKGFWSNDQKTGTDPTCFLQEIARQFHLLACLKWLGESQVIACVPLNGSVSFAELADLASVSEVLLSRTVRFTATSGFLREVQPAFVAHTELSAAFSSSLSYLDAARFLSDHIAPGGLSLGSMKGIEEDIFSPQSTFGERSHKQNRLSVSASPGPGDQRWKRQWLAFQESIGGAPDPAYLLRELDWQAIGKGIVVYICATNNKETNDVLLQLSHPRSLLVQTYESPESDMLNTLKINGRLLAVQCRKPFEPQPVNDAAVYILQPTFSLPFRYGTNIRDLLKAELQSHLGVLRATPSALLILAPRLLPEADAGDKTIEIQARMQDFAHLFLRNDGALEVGELIKLVHEVCSFNGEIVSTERLCSSNGATIALAVQRLA